MRLEFGVLVLQPFPQDSVVVDLAIDSKYDLSVVGDERLRTRVDTNNGETLVAEDRAFRARRAAGAFALRTFHADDAAGPVWTTMPDAARKAQHLGPVGRRIGVVNASENSVEVRDESASTCTSR